MSNASLAEQRRDRECVMLTRDIARIDKQLGQVLGATGVARSQMQTKQLHDHKVQLESRIKTLMALPYDQLAEFLSERC